MREGDHGVGASEAENHGGGLFAAKLSTITLGMLWDSSNTVQLQIFVHHAFPLTLYIKFYVYFVCKLVMIIILKFEALLCRV